MITTILSKKGGAGRSTLALNLAVAAAATGVSTLLIDSDEKGTIHQAFKRRLLLPDHFRQHNVDVQQSCSNMLPDSLPALAAEYDAIFIDTSVKFDFRIRQLVAVSDLAIVPISAGYPDLEDTLDIAHELRLIQIKNPQLAVHGVFNQWEPSNPIASTILRNLERFTDRLLMAKSVLRHRAEYATAFSYGVSVVEFEPASEAAAEVMALYAEIS